MASRSTYLEVWSGWTTPKKVADAGSKAVSLPSARPEALARTLITLAWQLAVFETAFESGASHPGRLMIDSPQENLGHGTGRDTLIEDAVSTDDFYQHLTQWLARHGNGAQVIVADNSPPELIEDRVIVRFSRDESEPPYGLIDDETG
jgi:hypothetical protein